MVDMSELNRLIIVDAVYSDVTDFLIPVISQ